MQEQKVPLKVEKNVFLKINELCSRISEVEWSGVLFYTMTGELHRGTAKIYLKDILPMDKGTAGYTEFKSDERFAEFMSDRMDELGEQVLKWKHGLIHSHNSMDVFFSGTDQDELYGDCNNYAQYLSFICNNRMEFVAKVAQYVKAEKELKSVPFYAKNSSGKDVVVKREPIKITSSFILDYDCEIEAPKSSQSKDTTFSKYLNKLFETKKPSNQNRNNFFGGWGSETTNSFFDKPQEDLDIDFVEAKEIFIQCSRIEDFNTHFEVKDFNPFISDTEDLLFIYESICESQNADVKTVARDFRANFITNETTNTKPRELMRKIQGVLELIDMNSPGEDSKYLKAIEKSLQKWLNNIEKANKYDRRTSTKI